MHDFSPRFTLEFSTVMVSTFYFISLHFSLFKDDATVTTCASLSNAALSVASPNSSSIIPDWSSASVFTLY